MPSWYYVRNACRRIVPLFKLGDYTRNFYSPFKAQKRTTTSPRNISESSPKKLSNPNPHENPTGIIEPSKAPEHKKRSINTWWYICKSSFRESVLIRGSWSCNYHRTHYDNMLRDKYVQFGSFLLRSKMAGPPRSWGTYWIMTGGYKPLNGPCSTSLTFN